MAKAISRARTQNRLPIDNRSTGTRTVKEEGQQKKAEGTASSCDCSACRSFISSRCRFGHEPHTDEEATDQEKQATTALRVLSFGGAKMKIRNQAPGLLKKAATSFKSKADVLRTKLIILASLRRRMALVAAVSRRIHTLVSSDGPAKQARMDYYDRALMLRKAMAAVSEDHETVRGPGHAGMVVVDASEMAMSDEDAHGFLDWTQSLFDDDNCYVADEDDVEEEDDDLVLDDAPDEPSVIEVIRSNREVQGLEFNMDEEIDEACDMFIRRFRSRMNRSF
ncbi:hypothetical protein PR202_ga15308 [Eleusine coracana subsp. coracana]|uniref:Uncharacterized protein n=1 Tax=Eleusine coracana subsp. coracana TaxID=191504 RepID=A0AAV5CJW3_ELECO|nr:hypothetical protein PR202_ga15308 [Eleusine coracana subsp. coracana]